MKSINAEDAFELMYELLKAHPWLNQAGVMKPEDAHAETEAQSFLLAGNLAGRWGDSSPAARRVVNSLLLDFMAKLRMPGHPISRSSWQVDEAQPKPEQALAVIAQQIRRAQHCFAQPH